jgi:membrane protein DedA with SNARE-associated domain
MISATNQQPDLATRFLSLAEQLMLSLGYPGLVLLIVVEQLIPPIPSTLILPLAGVLASQGVWSLTGVIIAGTVGSLVSALIFYALGHWLDQAILGRLLDRYGRWLGLDAARFEQLMRQFDRHGPLLVFTGRFVGTVRSLISIPAGMRRMHLALFLPLTALGSGLWNSMLATAGMLLGERWDELGALIARYDRLSLAMIFLAIVGIVLWQVGRRRAKHSPKIGS